MVETILKNIVVPQDLGVLTEAQLKALRDRLISVGCSCGVVDSRLPLVVEALRNAGANGAEPQEPVKDPPPQPKREEPRREEPRTDRPKQDGGRKFRPSGPGTGLARFTSQATLDRKRADSKKGKAAKATAKATKAETKKPAAKEG